jgi:hypothetical protein
MRVRLFGAATVALATTYQTIEDVQEQPSIHFLVLGDFTAIFTACDFCRLNEPPRRRLDFGPTPEGNYIHHNHL